MIKESSLFSQLLRQFPRPLFESLVHQHSGDRRSKGFSCWNQFVSMLFCHLAKADSLREICHGLSCCLGKLTHLGVLKAPNKSTLSYANRHRPAVLFEALFWSTLQRFREQGALWSRKRKFRFKNKLLSLDSTTISLCLSLFPWAAFRRSKGGVKAHVLLDHDDYMPAYVLVSPAKKHDLFVARRLTLNKGSVIMMDRAYVDYALFARWTREGVFFVTRLKDNADYEVTGHYAAPTRGNIWSDQEIRFTGPKARQDCPIPLRKIVVLDPEHEREIVLLTNHFGFGATTISEIYKDRWEIELFFKALKQNLKVKTFVGTTENALRIQLWTALIALLLLKWLHHLSKAKWSLSNLAGMLRLNLFTYRDLIEWLHKPFETPPVIPKIIQQPLPIPGMGQAY